MATSTLGGEGVGLSGAYSRSCASTYTYTKCWGVEHYMVKAAAALQTPPYNTNQSQVFFERIDTPDHKHMSHNLELYTTSGWAKKATNYAVPPVKPQKQKKHKKYANSQNGDHTGADPRIFDQSNQTFPCTEYCLLETFG